MTHNEAKGIAFTEVWHPDGWKINITAREDSPEMAAEALMVAIEHLGKTTGFTPAPDFSKAVKSAPVNATATSKPVEQDAFPLETTTVKLDATPLTIQVSNIMLASGGEHPRWVVQGGSFTKYGITCWPETLEEAGLKDKLDPLSDNLPEGQWLAYYVEDDKQRPDKVTRLVRQ